MQSWIARAFGGKVLEQLIGLEPLIKPLNLSEEEKRDLLAFLRALQE